MAERINLVRSAQFMELQARQARGALLGGKFDVVARGEQLELRYRPDAALQGARVPGGKIPMEQATIYANMEFNPSVAPNIEPLISARHEWVRELTTGPIPHYHPDIIVLPDGTVFRKVRTWPDVILFVPYGCMDADKDGDCQAESPVYIAYDGEK